MLDGAGDDGVGDPGEGTGEVVLAVRKGGLGGIGGAVGLFELPAGVVKGAELDGHTGADAKQGCQGPLRIFFTAISEKSCFLPG